MDHGVDDDNKKDDDNGDDNDDNKKDDDNGDDNDDNKKDDKDDDDETAASDSMSIMVSALLGTLPAQCSLQVALPLSFTAWECCL